LSYDGICCRIVTGVLTCALPILPAVIGRVGAIVENPKFQPNFSARKNLQLLAAGIGADRKIVDQVLEDVGLADRAGDRFRGFSLGIMQRLSVAATILKSPELLLLDDLTYGVDHEYICTFFYTI